MCVIRFLLHMCFNEFTMTTDELEQMSFAVQLHVEFVFAIVSHNTASRLPTFVTCFVVVLCA